MMKLLPNFRQDDHIPYHIYDSTEIERKEGTYDLDGFVPFGNRTDTTSDCPYPSQRLSGGTATQAA